MKKVYRIVTFLSILLYGTTLSAQSLIKIGPSISYNWEGFEEKLYLNFGGEISYEFPISSKFSVNLAGIVHWGNHKNSIDKNLTQRNLFIGIQPELHYYFKEAMSGGYFGIGGDLQHFTSKNYFVPTPNDPEPTFVNWEVNFGISFGTLGWLNPDDLNFRIKRDLYINPYIYIGFNPSDQNDYPIHARMGINFGF